VNRQNFEATFKKQSWSM